MQTLLKGVPLFPNSLSALSDQFLSFLPDFVLCIESHPSHILEEIWGSGCKVVTIVILRNYFEVVWGSWMAPPLDVLYHWFWLLHDSGLFNECLFHFDGLSLLKIYLSGAIQIGLISVPAGFLLLLGRQIFPISFWGVGIFFSSHNKINKELSNINLYN